MSCLPFRLSPFLREKMKIPSSVVDELITGSQSDIRQVLTMLSTWKLSRNDMNFDEGKELYVALHAVYLKLHIRCRVRANEKYSIMTPFAATNKILGPYLFSKTCRETLNEKIEYYFHDPAFMPLFIQVRLTMKYLLS
jgi:replication factor C subunit 1